MKDDVSCEVRSDRLANCEGIPPPLFGDCAANAVVTFAIVVGGFWIGIGSRRLSGELLLWFLVVKNYESACEVSFATAIMPFFV